MSKRNYCTEFSYCYKFYNQDKNEWQENTDYQSINFTCYTKDIDKEVETWIINKLSSQKVKDIRINICGKYLTV